MTLLASLSSGVRSRPIGETASNLKTNRIHWACYLFLKLLLLVSRTFCTLSVMKLTLVLVGTKSDCWHVLYCYWNVFVICSVVDACGIRHVFWFIYYRCYDNELRITYLAVIKSVLCVFIALYFAAVSDDSTVDHVQPSLEVLMASCMYQSYIFCCKYS